MADETTTAAASVDAPVATAATESKEPTRTNDEAAGPSEKNEEAETATEHVKSDEPAVADEKAPAAEATPADASADSTLAGGKDKKRKSIGGVPEHKTKKLNKKKSMPNLQLDCKPGEFYWARLKGYPPWPSVICDEEMLPELLLATRPVSTARPDGSLRDDFKEGGKNAKERTFPIMFLHTNEFQWMVNTSLAPLDPTECDNLPQNKMTKDLRSAYAVAAENHPIEYFKKLLAQWQEEEEAIRRADEEAAAEAERRAAEDAAKAERAAKDAEANKDKPKKKAPRKSKAADEDVDMDDTEAPKSSKKRKKDAESDAEGKPKKTPKVMKLNAPKTPNSEASATKKSATKTRKKVVTAPKFEEKDESRPQQTEEEKLIQREKAILYLRHRLQKGFVARDQAPQESEMAGMAEFFAQLETYENLEPHIIRTTKIHKVLKAIIKLASIPKDAEYQFKKRSSAMLEEWNKRLEAAPVMEEKPTAASVKPNGELPAALEEIKDTEMKDTNAEANKEIVQKAVQDVNQIDAKVSAVEAPETPLEKTAEPESDAKLEAEGDESMQIPT